jgi:glycosyltransferase involved in cell wall biosynthesis
MSIREAFALGVPVAGSDIGSIPHIVENGGTGALYPPGDAGQIADRVLTMWSDPAGLERMAHRARREFESRYTETRNHERLIEIYMRAIESRNRSARELH